MASKHDDTIPRAITLPVVGPVGRTWDEFGEACREAWADATALANWAATTLYAHDIRRKAADKKLKPMPKVYLYGLAGKQFAGWKEWAGCMSSAQSLLRGIEQKYRASRFDLLWRSAVSLPTFRYPHPYPVHNASWTARLEGGKPTVEFNLKGKSWTLLLRHGPEFGRQLALFRKLVSGEFKRCEMSLYRTGCREKHTMVKLVARLPRPEAKVGHTVIVRTGPEHFWISEAEGRQPWIVNADHVRRWVETHRHFLQRIREDAKRDKHLSSAARRNIDKARSLRCEKNDNRIDSFCHMATAQLVEWAQSTGAGEVVYDDVYEGYVSRFPWHKLRGYLAYKLEAAGIAFTHRGGTQEGRTTTEEVCPQQQVRQAAEQIRMVGRLARRPALRGASASLPEGSATRATSNGSARHSPLTS